MAHILQQNQTLLDKGQIMKESIEYK
jgi:hypothetical protein